MRFYKLVAWSLGLIILSSSISYANPNKRYLQKVDFSFGLSGNAAASGVEYLGGYKILDCLSLCGCVEVGISGEPEYGSVAYEKIGAGMNVYLSDKKIQPYFSVFAGGLFQNTITKHYRLGIFHLTPFTSVQFNILDVQTGFTLGLSIDVSGDLLNYKLASYSGYEAQNRKLYLHPRVRIGYCF